MPSEVIQLLNNWQESWPARFCGCGAIVLDASPGQPCERCRMDTEEQGVSPNYERDTCLECGGERFVQKAEHWASELMGWTPCPACGDWDCYD